MCNRIGGLDGLDLTVVYLIHWLAKDCDLLKRIVDCEYVVWLAIGML